MIRSMLRKYSGFVRYRIATFVNRPELYEGMRASFRRAGFVEPHAHYTIEQGEPFSAITRLGRAHEPYVILAHQDVRCDLGNGIDDLEQRLGELTAIDPNWAVAGNAGGAYRDRGLLYCHLDDGNGRHRVDGLPRRVVSLDENFLILRTARRPRCSPDLSGFHTYGADVCLNAAQNGSTAYVIDFLVTHLSPGNREGLVEAHAAFMDTWSRRRIAPTWVMTTCGPLTLARPKALRRVLAKEKVRRRFLPEKGVYSVEAGSRVEA